MAPRQAQVTRFLLVRHATNPTVGKLLAGRSPGVHLDSTGLQQAQALAQRLRELPLAAVYASPLERARQTAAPIAQAHGLDVRILEGLHEFDFGSWTGKRFDELSLEPAWKDFNEFRSATRVPGGEVILEVLSRMVASLEPMRREHPNGVVALVSHGDPLRALLTYFLGMPLDLIQRIELAPASVSILDLADYGARVLCLNYLGSLSEYAK
jgi:probable phosphomutase (TIGR03848 family)